MTCVGNFLFSKTNLHVVCDNIVTNIKPKLKKAKHVLLIDIGCPDKIKQQWIDIDSSIQTAYCNKKT